MTEELENQIVSIAPYMFRYEDWDDPTKSLLSFGFSCGDGWFNIIKELVENISKLDTNKSVKVGQVKEKFGTLRFYIDVADDEIYDKIYDEIGRAEGLSAITCENCGRIGHRRGTRWFRTLCQDCYDKKDL